METQSEQQNTALHFQSLSILILNNVFCWQTNYLLLINNVKARDPVGSKNLCVYQ